MKEINIFVENWQQDKRNIGKPRNIELTGFQVFYLFAGILLLAMLILGPFAS